MKPGLIMHSWLLGLLLVSTAVQAAPALAPDFLDYLVTFADDRDVFDAADYEQLAAAGKLPDSAQPRPLQPPTSTRSDPVPTPARKEKHP